MKTTYFTGAGASYNSFPLNSHLVDAMENVGQYLNFDDAVQRLGNRMMQISNSARACGSIDQYAITLDMQGKIDELDELRNMVDNFFTLWPIMPSNLMETRHYGQHRSKRFDQIDNRYITLLPEIREKKPDHSIIPDKYNFISWNYDQLLQAAYNFVKGLRSWDSVNAQLPYMPKTAQTRSLRICQLNGISGYKFSDDQRRSVTYMDGLGELDNQATDDAKIRISIQEYARIISEYSNLSSAVTFAWFEHPNQKIIQTRAEEILSETEVLVVIGYSFPEDNKQIDKMLLEKLKHGVIRKIVYQDKDPSLDKLIPFFLESDIQITEPKKANYIPVEFVTNTDSFYIPRPF
jgi:hypothetical protein